MPRKTRNHPLDLPPLELDCMRMLWALGQGTVHEIRGRLFPERPLAYTTVMTVMDRLVRKGIVERQKGGRSYRYRPLVAERVVLERSLDRLARAFFKGSRERLKQYLEGVSSVQDLVGPVSTAMRAERSSATPRVGSREGDIDPSLL